MFKLAGLISSVPKIAQLAQCARRENGAEFSPACSSSYYELCKGRGFAKSIRNLLESREKTGFPKFELRTLNVTSELIKQKLFKARKELKDEPA